MINHDGFPIAEGYPLGDSAEPFQRKANLSFQTKKEKRLGKMWFVYNKELVEQYYDALPDEF